MNPNDKSAKYYDIVYSLLKPQEVTEEEISLTESYLNDNSSILDIACGTGRHLISLAKKGYNVTGVESSEGMLKELRLKIRDLGLEDTEIIQEDIFKVDIKPASYNLVTMFWNAFNEICLTEKQAEDLLRKCYELIKENGKVIINIDNSNNIDPEHFDFKFEVTYENKEYKASWKTISYEPNSNTSTSEEVIAVYENDKQIDKIRGEIKQRYWSFNEIKNLAEKIGFNVSNKDLKTSDELYIILEK